MIITCDECNSSFNVGDGLIKDQGSKVRCSKCDNVFVAYPPADEEIEMLDTAEDDLALDADEQMPADEEDLGLDDLDAELGDFLDDDASDLVMDNESSAGDDLPDLDDLEDLADLNQADLMEDDAEAELEALDLEAENDENPALAGGGELDLTDLGLEAEANSLAPEGSSLGLEMDDSDQLDLSDLERVLDDDMSPEAAAGSDIEELSFEGEGADQGVEDTAETDLEVEAAEELDLSDLDLEMDDASVSDKATAPATEDLELDLSDLTEMAEKEEAPAVEAPAEELDFELDLESVPETTGNEPVAAADSKDIDELDISDLEGLLESEASPAASAAAEDAAQNLDMDLDFQIDDDKPKTEAAVDDLDSDELDFSDLEQMLESDETPAVETGESHEPQDLDLQFDLDEPSGDETKAAVGEDAVAAADKNAAEDDQDDEFLDIEQLLEEGEDSGPLESVELNGDATDLPLEMEAALDDASKGAEAELELDFDLESELQAKEDSVEGDHPTEPQVESNLLASDEVESLGDADTSETDFQNDSQTSVLSTEDFASEEFTDSDSAYGATHVLPDAEDEQPVAQALVQAPESAVPQKTRSKKPVLVIVLLLLLSLGVFTVPNMLGIKIPYISDIKIPYLSDLDVKIPYLSDWLNPEPQDVAGNLRITPLGQTINGRFVKNAKSGQLFVIQGQIKNEYDHPRSYIKITGKLYQKGNKIAKKATVYCGNMLSNQELTIMDISTINQTLSTRSGKKQSNFKVKTGKSVPFMIVFDKLPQNLNEYTIEVESSSI